jgi:hypothetical protein
MNTSIAMANARRAFDTIYALQPMDGRAGVTGTTLTVRQWDGSAVRYQIQHVAGDTLRGVRTELEGLEPFSRTVTPLDTDTVANDYIRDIVVEVLR